MHRRPFEVIHQMPRNYLSAPEIVDIARRCRAAPISLVSIALKTDAVGTSTGGTAMTRCNVGHPSIASICSPIPVTREGSGFKKNGTSAPRPTAISSSRSRDVIRRLKHRRYHRAQHPQHGARVARSSAESRPRRNRLFQIDHHSGGNSELLDECASRPRREVRRQV